MSRTSIRLALESRDGVDVNTTNVNALRERVLSDRHVDGWYRALIEQVEGANTYKVYAATKAEKVATSKRPRVKTVGLGVTNLLFPEIDRYDYGDVIDAAKVDLWNSEAKQHAIDRCIDLIGDVFYLMRPQQQAALMSHVHQTGGLGKRAVGHLNDGNVMGFLNEVWGSGANIKQGNSILQASVDRRALEFDIFTHVDENIFSSIQ